MGMIKKFDRKSTENLSRQVESALAMLSADTGVEFSIRGGIYEGDGMSCRLKLECKLPGALDPDQKELAEFGYTYAGLEDDQLDAKFEYNGELYQLCGLRRRARKYPFIAQNLANGKKYKFGADFIRKHVTEGKS